MKNNIQNKIYIVSTPFSRVRAVGSIQTVSHKSFVVCPKCHNVKYRGVWHAPDAKGAVLMDTARDMVTTALCGACKMQQDGRYAGLITLHDVPKNLENRMIIIIQTEAAEALAYNPQQRVLEVTETIDGFEIRTSSVSLARSIASRIQSVFRTSEIEHSYESHACPSGSRFIVTKISEYFPAEKEV